MTAAEYKGLRIAAGLTQLELAERLGVSEQTVKNRESARHPIPPEAALAVISVARGVPAVHQPKPPRSRGRQGSPARA